MSTIVLEICGVSPKYAELDFCHCIKIMWDIFSNLQNVLAIDRGFLKYDATAA